MIYNLEDREMVAWKIINRLHKLHMNVNWLVTLLQNTNKTITTTQLISIRDEWAVIYTIFNDFNTTNGTWFSTSWSDYSTPLSDSITSLSNINTIINDGLQNYYWDTETNKPIVSVISQTHRDSLATSILAELE